MMKRVPASAIETSPGLAALDRRLTRWMADHGVFFLRVSIGVVFLWFGVLKFVPGLSPADRIATDTTAILTGGLITGDLARVMLAGLETIIGVGMISGRSMRLVLLLLFGQMAGTITPLVLFPELTWKTPPLVPTLEGQYILKNLVLVAAGMVIGATVRGGGLESEPETGGSDPGELEP
jgi:uncharacterized membrane protein YkgB